MGRFDGILICTDLDGTLFRKDKSISNENREAIEYFKCEGGYFTFITGRLPYYSRTAYDAVKPNVPFGCINGGGVYDGAAERYVWALTIPREAVELVECIDRKFPEVGIQVCTLNNTYFAKESEIMPEFRRLTGLPNLTCDYRENMDSVAKYLFVTTREDYMAAIEKTLLLHPRAEEFTFVRSESYLFEILPKGVHKGLALAKIVEHLKLDPKKTIAIGDFDNDVGMLREAGVGVAVANASQKAKAAADIITVSNEEHAIARVIRDLDSGKIVFDNIVKVNRFD